MSETQGSRTVPRGVLVLAALAAFSFGALVTAARGDHWHNYSYNGHCAAGIFHGLAHGPYTTDGEYTSQVSGGTCGYRKLCAVGNFNYSNTERLRGWETFGTNATCAIAVTGWAEAAGWARVFAETSCSGCTYVLYIDTHYHDSHN